MRSEVVIDGGLGFFSIIEIAWAVGTNLYVSCKQRTDLSEFFGSDQKKVCVLGTIFYVFF
jgi:hypothetical protein